MTINMSSNISKANTCGDEPDAIFGLITDVQYCDSDDRVKAGNLRHYRNSLKVVRDAVDAWKQYETDSSKANKFKFIINLGDTVDQRSKKVGDPKLQMAKVLELFPDAGPQVLHVWGNHERYSFGQKELFDSPLNTRLALKQDTQIENLSANCYSVEVSPKLRLVVLDFYDIFLFDRSIKNSVKDAKTSYQDEEMSFVKKLKRMAIDPLANIPTLAFSGGE